MQVVTGAFGYSGKYITARLLAAGEEVRTLTNSTQRANPFKQSVQAFPYNFDKPAELVNTLKGAETLFNTYWVRFNTSKFNQADAVKNTLALFEAAKEAGVDRIVHISITNPSLQSPLEYFRGKAQLEEALIASGLPYAILRPAVLFGKEDILINNIAWALRRLPMFGIFGDGQYCLQPIFVDDLAKLAVEQSQQRDNSIIDAIGPETFTYRGLVEYLGALIGKKRPVIGVTPAIGYAAAVMIGKLMGDVLLTRDEIRGLMQNLLYTTSQPAGSTRLSDWAKENAATLGIRYASELARRNNRSNSYTEL